MEERGKEISALSSKPTLPPHLTWYMSAFNILSSRRQYGMNGPLPIPVSEIVFYLWMYPWFDRDVFIRYIIAIDNYFLKNKYEEIERNSKKETKKSSMPPAPRKR